jgi:hypothetical protein
VWWVERPGIQSNLRPNPGTNHECITSKLLVINVKFVCAGKTSVLRVRNKRRDTRTFVNSSRTFCFFNRLYLAVALKS